MLDATSEIGFVSNYADRALDGIVRGIELSQPHGYTSLYKPFLSLHPGLFLKKCHFLHANGHANKCMFYTQLGNRNF